VVVDAAGAGSARLGRSAVRWSTQIVASVDRAERARSWRTEQVLTGVMNMLACAIMPRTGAHSRIAMGEGGPARSCT